MTDPGWVRPSEFSFVLASVLRGARRDAGMTLRSVQRASGGYFLPSAINGYEREQRQVSLDRLCYLAELYGTSGDELVRRILAALGRAALGGASSQASPVVRNRAETLAIFYRDVVGKGDSALLDELCTPTFIDHGTPAKFVTPKALDGFRAWMDLFHRTFSNVSINLEDALFVGDQAVVRLSLDLWHSPRAGKHARRHMALGMSEWVRFEGGRLAERWGIDGSWLLEQVDPDMRDLERRSS